MDSDRNMFIHLDQRGCFPGDFQQFQHETLSSVIWLGMFEDWIHAYCTRSTEN
jgi:hypothetical protein